MARLRLIFAGSGPFGAASLRALQVAGHALCAVLSQPDRPAGRRMELRPTAVAEAALELDLPLHRPARLDAAARAELETCRADALVVADFGRLLPASWLDLCPGGSLNVHASLLPRWRGAAPIERGLEAGDAEGGCTIMLLDAGMDTGDILLQGALPFTPDETAGSARARLAPLGAELLVRYLQDFDPAHPQRRVQDESQACHAPVLRKEEAAIDWRQPATRIAAKIRAFNPRPVATTRCGGETLRLWHAQAHDRPAAAPGSVLRTDRDGIWVACGDGQVQITELQRPSRRRLPAADFCNALPLAGRRLE